MLFCLVFTAGRRVGGGPGGHKELAENGDLLAAKDQDKSAAEKDGHSQDEEKPAIVLHDNTQCRQMAHESA